RLFWLMGRVAFCSRRYRMTLGVASAAIPFDLIGSDAKPLRNFCPRSACGPDGSDRISGDRSARTVARNHVGDIRGLGPGNQVRRVAARRIVAGMAHDGSV